MIKKRIISIIGVRPEFIRIKKLSRELSKHFDHIVIHTGQHYDYQMSKIFFDEFELQKPDYYLELKPENSIKRIAEMIVRLEKIFLKLKPSAVLVHGDSDSTLAGALTSAKLKIHTIHVEAGMRSFDKIPEETNRKIVDHIADILFCSSKTAYANLKNEGISKNIYISGDLMHDVFKKAKDSKSTLSKYNLQPNSYYYLTIHREENTLNLKNFNKIYNEILKLNQRVIFPIHPRTQKLLKHLKITDTKVLITKPLSYLENIALMQNAKFILTDSGGIQKEAYWLKVPCFTIRKTTEWVETVNSGWNTLVLDKIEKISSILKDYKTPKVYKTLYNKESASAFIAIKLTQIL